ncbi:MAG: chromate efflux transporter [Burkholderiaceae bacterium]|nr:chromate efflux transporter [Burkholderiaceae bacterium]
MRESSRAGSPREVFGAFLRLGLTSFGGPVAHLGYFRREFVERRRWLDEHDYADLVALCQFLPGPASSQVGFALGLRRAGWPGAIAAWLGFTLPSALLLALFALGFAREGGNGALFAAIVHSLKIVAVAVVAQAVWSMARSLLPDWPRRVLALLAAAVALAVPGAAAQLLALAACALVGARLLVSAPIALGGGDEYPVGRRSGVLALALFVALLAALPLAASVSGNPALRLFEAFYRAGALVFGGGHVVLPLLQASVVEPGWVSESTFLAGYGAAQAVPGPLFTFAAYLGAVIAGAGGSAGQAAVGQAGLAAAGVQGAWLGAGACLVAVFLPGILVLVGALPFWERLRQRAALRSAVAGVNAGVVGVLLAALIDPVSTAALRSAADAIVAAILVVLLMRLRWPPLAVVAIAVALGALRALVGA